MISKTSARKSVETRETYEAILNRSQARYPDATFPDKVNFDSKIESDNFIWQPTSDTKHEETEKEVVSFDQLHINAVHQRYVSADEMKFLILVDKLLSSGDTKYTSSIEIKQALTRTIEEEFPHYLLPKKGHRKIKKMSELRQLFRLTEFRTHLSQEDFEEARNKARKAKKFPAKNIQAQQRAFSYFQQDLKKEGRWTSINEVFQLWTHLPDDKKLKYKNRVVRIKKEIAKFEQNKLPQLLNEPQLHWLLRVSFSDNHSNLTVQASEAKKFLSEDELEKYHQMCHDKRLELELETIFDIEVL